MSRMDKVPSQPLAEVFGFPINNNSATARRFQRNRLCPFNNKVPSCTKDKVEDPLGVCSVFDNDTPTITCPIRFREDWLITDDAARFFFPSGTRWTALTEVRLPDKHGKSAGNIDLVLVAYDEQRQVTDFGALEVQAVYISGNVRAPFEHFMQDPEGRSTMRWTGRYYPHPDYLSSSRKRLAPQLLYKGGILKQWGKKQAVAIHTGFFATLPELTPVAPDAADIVLLVYGLQYEPGDQRYHLVLREAIYTEFMAALERIGQAEAGDINRFITGLQARLDSQQAPALVSLDPTLTDVAEATTVSSLLPEEIDPDKV